MHGKPAFVSIEFVLFQTLSKKIAYTLARLQLKTYAELKGLKVGLLNRFPILSKELTPQPQYLSILVNVLAAAGDILIAAALCILLHRSRTSSQRCPCPKTVRKNLYLPVHQIK